MLINLFLLESFWKVYIVYLFKHIQQHRSLEVLYRIILFQSKTWNRNHKCHFHDAEAYSWEVLGTSSYHNLIMTDTLIVISLKHRLFHLISMKKSNWHRQLVTLSCLFAVWALKRQLLQNLIVSTFYFSEKKSELYSHGWPCLVLFSHPTQHSFANSVTKQV